MKPISTWDKNTIVAIPLIRHATLDYLKIDIDIAKIGSGDIAVS